MRRKRRPWRSAVVVAVLVSAIAVTGGVLEIAKRSDASDPTATDPVRVADAPVNREPLDPGGLRTAHEFDRTAHSTSDPASIWVVVNKTHPVTPSDFRPEMSLVRGYQVASPAAGPLGRLLEAADRRGLGFKIASAFRSYDYQLRVHAATAAARGEVVADRLSARAGHSEHQTGLAVDLVTPADQACNFEACFADTPGGRWLARNAARFGFVVRYQPGTMAITGYAPEPWHLRYVGRSLALELHRTGVRTMEEFFGIPGGRYPGP